jgi:hypothetical protein
VLAGGLPSGATRGIDDGPGAGGGVADAGESIVAGAGEFDVDTSVLLKDTIKATTIYSSPAPKPAG